MMDNNKKAVLWQGFSVSASSLMNGLWGFYIVTVVLVVIQVIFTVKLAKRLKRDAAIWGTMAVITTGLSSLVLAFLGEKGEASMRKTRTPSYSSGFGSSYQVSQKTCGACGRIVSVSAHAGQSCPHCGAYWGEEKSKYR
ncbi:MAG: hypothetical protein EHM72_18910 [Calditrichaeota bacterium]|nr:MAG: hypothetical protein EHM72_18910 [Calditrichota bacterium]